MFLLAKNSEGIHATKHSSALTRTPLIIAHRGAATDAPENTLAAFVLALRQGADGIEFDVHLSADGVPVVIHDARLDRTTSGIGRVKDHSLRALRRLDAGSWFNQLYPQKSRALNVNVKIPLLSEVLSLVRRRRCKAFLEIKEASAVYPGIEAKVLEQIANAGAGPFTTVVSFDLRALGRCRAIDPSQALGIDFTRPLLALRKAQSIAAVSLHPHWAFASERFIARAHAAGLQVMAWGLELPGPMRRRMAGGIDGLITGNPARALEVRASLGVGEL